MCESSTPSLTELRLEPERVVINADVYGNTSSASIPIALCEAIDQGRVSPGDHLVLVGFGAGLSWAAVAVEWTAPVTPGGAPAPSVEAAVSDGSATTAAGRPS